MARPRTAGVEVADGLLEVVDRPDVDVLAVTDALGATTGRPSLRWIHDPGAG